MSSAASLRLRADLAIVATAFLWGSTFVVVKTALSDVSPLLFLALRFAIAAVLLWIVFRRRFSLGGEVRPILKGGLVTAAFLCGGYALQTVGLQYTTASKSAFLTGLYIVLVPIFSSFVQRSVPGFVEWTGAGLATAGTALLSAGPGGWSFNKGDWMTVGCAASYAAHMLFVERYSRRINYELLTLLQIAGVSLFCGLLLPWVETPRIVWSPFVAFALILTAVFATAVSFTLYTWAQRHTTATRAALLFALEPVFAGFTGWLWASERWTWSMASGAALILTGIVLVELKPRPTGGHP